ncbi:MAG: hypothetical protein PF495_20665 [Spirochaetales bacterium]|nr:hypothetical protein [Spirochaetales bacterium]
MCKVTIIGNAAGGKSTICKAIAEAHGLPLHAVDKLQWKPGWTPVPEEEVTSEIRRVMANDRWLLDGWGPWETIEERCEKADTIIFVDHSVWIHLWWATKRQIKALVNPKSVEKPDGCDLVPMTWKMYKMIWMINRDLRPKLLKLVESFEGNKDVFHIRSPKELRSFAFEYC